MVGRGIEIGSYSGKILRHVRNYAIRRNQFLIYIVDMESEWKNFDLIKLCVLVKISKHEQGYWIGCEKLCLINFKRKMPGWNVWKVKK